jgi:hypothetical protein
MKNSRDRSNLPRYASPELLLEMPSPARSGKRVDRMSMTMTMIISSSTQGGISIPSCHFFGRNDEITLGASTAAGGYLIPDVILNVAWPPSRGKRSTSTFFEIRSFHHDFSHSGRGSSKHSHNSTSLQICRARISWLSNGY